MSRPSAAPIWNLDSSIALSDSLLIATGASREAVTCLHPDARSSETSHLVHNPGNELTNLQTGQPGLGRVQAQDLSGRSPSSTRLFDSSYTSFGSEDTHAKGSTEPWQDEEEAAVVTAAVQGFEPSRSVKVCNMKDRLLKLW
jgi:hypothetical protein